MESFRKSLALAKKAAALIPNDPGPLKTMVNAYTYVAISQTTKGDEAGGLSTYGEGARVAEQLERLPGLDQQAILSVIGLLEKKGEAELHARAIETALLSYRKALQMDERMNLQFPNARSRHSISLSYARLGDALAEHGDLPATLEQYRKAIGIREELVQQYPGNALYQRELAMLYDWIGHFLGNPYKLNVGDRNAAEQYYRKFLALTSKLAAADPENAAAQMDLSFSCEFLADTLADSAPEEAVNMYRRALATTRGLLEKAPREFRYRRRQAMQLRALVAPLCNLGDRRSARDYLRQALEQLQQLQSESPGHTGLQLDQHWLWLAWADLSQADGQPEEALANYTNAMEQAQKNVTARPNDLLWRWRLADAYSRLGQYYSALAARTPVVQRLANWRAAHVWLSKSLEVWDGWNAHGVSSVFNTSRRERAARALAQCDAVLSHLTAEQKH